nr:MAG TPA: hypothetical protein [Caudoviricetes sp.]
MPPFVLSIFILTAFVAYCSFLILELLASIHQNYITKKGPTRPLSFVVLCLL